jgi:subtilisin family serine protease
LQNQTTPTPLIAFNWLAWNTPHGTIVNWSYSLPGGPTSASNSSGSLANSVINAHNQGIIIVVPAGNDGCNTSGRAPANLPEAFVVGGTSTPSGGFDSVSTFSRQGWNIPAFAPATQVPVMNQFGTPVLRDCNSVIGDRPRFISLEGSVGQRRIDI